MTFFTDRYDDRLEPPEPKMAEGRCEYCGCNAEDAGGEFKEFEGETMCARCFESKTTICPQCKERDFTDHIEPDGRCWCCHRDEKAAHPTPAEPRDDRDDALDHEFKDEAAERRYIEDQREHLRGAR